MTRSATEPELLPGGVFAARVLDQKFAKNRDWFHRRRVVWVWSETEEPGKRRVYHHVVQALARRDVHRVLATFASRNLAQLARDGFERALGQVDNDSLAVSLRRALRRYLREAGVEVPRR